MVMGLIIIFCFIFLLRVHPAPGAASERRDHWAFPQAAGAEVQLREDDLPQVSTLFVHPDVL